MAGPNSFHRRLCFDISSAATVVGVWHQQLAKLVGKVKNTNAANNEESTDFSERRPRHSLGSDSPSNNSRTATRNRGPPPKTAVQNLILGKSFFLTFQFLSSKNFTAAFFDKTSYCLVHHPCETKARFQVLLCTRFKMRFLQRLFGLRQDGFLLIVCSLRCVKNSIDHLV